MGRKNRRKRVAFFVYYGWLSISPSLVSALKILSENGYRVDVIYVYDESFGYFEPGLDKVHALPVLPGKIKQLSRLRFFQACYHATKVNTYDFVIGMDHEGIIAAGILGRVRKIPYCYYSLELLAKEDIPKKAGFNKIIWSILKILESYFSRRALATIVQDHYRAEILIQDNLLDKSKIFIVPNSYYFTGGNLDINNYDPGLPADKKIVIYAGSIVEEVAIKEIVSQVQGWPEDTVLVLHAPHRTPYLAEVEQIIEQHNLKNKIIVSVKRLSFDELCLLIRQAQIGISFYKSVDKNTELACSGKVSFYSSQGLPMIINNISPQSMELISKYRCGVCVQSSEEVGQAIQLILRNYSEYAANATTAFEQELDFKKYFNQVLAYAEEYQMKTSKTN